MHSTDEAIQLVEERATTLSPSVNYALDGYEVAYNFMADKPHNYRAILSLYRTDDDGNIINDLAPNYTIVCDDDGIKLLDSLDKPIKYIE